MLPIIKKPPISHRRKTIAVGIAGAADLLQLVLLPAMGLGYILDDIIDVMTSLILIAVCGFKWQFILAFLLELVPGLDLLPTWTAVALLIPSTSPAAASPDAAPSTHNRITAMRVPPIQTDHVTSTGAALPPATDP